VIWWDTDVSEDLAASIFRVKIEAATMVSYHITACCHKPEDHNMYLYHCENHQSLKEKLYFKYTHIAQSNDVSSSCLYRCNPLSFVSLKSGGLHEYSEL
jgi:hypothetical protein